MIAFHWRWVNVNIPKYPCFGIILIVQLRIVKRTSVFNEIKDDYFRMSDAGKAKIDSAQACRAESGEAFLFLVLRKD